MKIREHSLSLFFGAIFLIALAGQSIAGLLVFNDEQTAHGEETLGWLDFVTSSHFDVDVAENWQSEYLQFFLFIAATVWLVQKGSPESKKLGHEGLGTQKEQLIGRYARPDSPAWAKAKGLRLWLLSNSLLLVMGLIFALSWLAQASAGLTVYNADQASHGEPTISFGEYILSAEFWNRTLQNWQSEFLAVCSMVVLAIVLRQRGSAESKPVGAPNAVEAVEAE